MHALHNRYTAAGGKPRSWIFNAMINAHARKQQPEAAFRLAEQMRAGAGLPWDEFTYTSLLNVCAKAQHPPYPLPPEYAQRAQALFREMLQAGVSPSLVAHNTLMDTLAKAGDVDATFEAFDAMLRGGVPPDTYSFNILISACQRAGQPVRAQQVVAHLMPRLGAPPDTVTWNSLLGAFAAAQDLDGAHRVWRRMQEAGAVPDRITESHLTEAFCSNPSFAGDLVVEAAAYRALLLRLRMRRGLPRSFLEAAHLLVWRRGDGGLPKWFLEVFRAQLWLRRQWEASTGHADPRREWAAFGAVREPLSLDLHSMSRPTARAALLQRLAYLTHIAGDTIQNTAHEPATFIEGLLRRAPAAAAVATTPRSRRQPGVAPPPETPAVPSGRRGPPREEEEAAGGTEPGQNASGGAEFAVSAEKSSWLGDCMPSIQDLLQSDEEGLTIIVGRGSHSLGQQPVLGELVQDTCAQLGLQCDVLPNTGRMFIPRQSLFRYVARRKSEVEQLRLVHLMHWRLGGMLCCTVVGTSIASVLVRL